MQSAIAYNTLPKWGNEYAREQEIEAVYGIAMKQYHENVSAPGATVRALPPKAYTPDGARYCFANVPLEPAGACADRRKRLKVKTKAAAAPALAALHVPDWTAKEPSVAAAKAVLTPRGSAASSSTTPPVAATKAVLTPRAAVPAKAAPTWGPSPAARAERARLCRDLKDGFMNKLNKGASNRNLGRSHTERYQNCSEYRAECIANGTPERLVFHGSGHTARLDGQMGDQWP